MNPLFILLLLSCFAGSSPQPKAHRLVGKPAPSFEFTALDGQIVSTATPGKVTLISFWFVGCPASMAQMPLLNQIAQAYPQVHVIGIAPHTPSALAAYCNRKDTTHLFARFQIGSNLPIPTFPTVAACTQSPYAGSMKIGPDCKHITKAFNTKGYPYVFFVDKEGVVRAVEDGFFMQPTDDQIQTALAKYKERIENMLAE